MIFSRVSLVLSLLSGAAISAPSCPPESALPGALVSIQWLDDHLCDENVRVVDLRSEDAYKTSHIVGSVNIPFGLQSAWSVMGEGDLMLEMPPIDDLFKTLADAGISNPEPETKVILVTSSEPGTLEPGPRVAATLGLAGLGEGRVAILDGGYGAWSSAELAVSTLARKKEAGSYDAEPNMDFIVDMDYVVASYDRYDSILVDARASNLFSGEAEDPRAEPGTKGHLPGAVSLPSALIWEDNGTFKSESELMAFVEDAMGEDVAAEMKSGGEVIVYCSTGGKASAWWFVLSRILGFEDVKIYDGSAQEWSRYYEMEVSE